MFTGSTQSSSTNKNTPLNNKRKVQETYDVPITPTTTPFTTSSTSSYEIDTNISYEQKIANLETALSVQQNTNTRQAKKIAALKEEVRQMQIRLNEKQDQITWLQAVINKDVVISTTPANEDLTSTTVLKNLDSDVDMDSVGSEYSGSSEDEEKITTTKKTLSKKPSPPKSKTSKPPALIKKKPAPKSTPSFNTRHNSQHTHTHTLTYTYIYIFRK